MQAGSLLTVGLNWGTTANNGNLQTQTITGGGKAFTQTYGYEALNRIASICDTGAGSACSGTGDINRIFSYDAFGNLKVADSKSGAYPIFGSTPGASVTYPNNRRTDPTGTSLAASYDAAGNQLTITGSGALSSHWRAERESTSANALRR